MATLVAGEVDRQELMGWMAALAYAAGFKAAGRHYFIPLVCALYVRGSQLVVATGPFPCSLRSMKSTVSAHEVGPRSSGDSTGAR